jgi:streptogramin lyase
MTIMIGKTLFTALYLLLYAAYCHAQDWKHYTADGPIYSIAVKGDTIFASGGGGLVKTHPSMSSPIVYTRLTPDFDSYTTIVHGVYLLPTGEVTMSKGTDSYFYQNGAFAKGNLPDFTSAVTDKDNNVWFGKYGEGLSKYDGQNITKFSNTISFDDIDINAAGDSIWMLSYQSISLLSNSVITSEIDFMDFPPNVMGLLSFEVDKDGRLWVEVEEVFNPEDPNLSYTSDVLYCLKDREWIKVDVLGEIHEIEKDINGAVWVSTHSDLIHYDDLNSKQTYPYDPKMVGVFETASMHAYRKGVLLGGDVSGGLYLFENGVFTKLPTSNSGLLSNYIRKILFDKDGYAWINTTRGLVKFDGEKWTRYDQYNPILNGILISDIAFDDSGVLWVASDNVLYTLSNNVLVRKAIFSKRIYYIEKGKDGSVWLVLDGRLAKYSTNEVRELYWEGLTEKENIRDIAVDSVNNVWVALSDNGLRKFDGVKFIDYSKHLPSPYLTSVNIDNKGRVWVSSVNGGTTVYDGNVWKNVNTFYPDFPEVYVGKIMSEGDTLWVATTNGVVKIKNDDLTIYADEEFKLPSPNVIDVAIDKNGNLWFGTSEGLGIWNVGVLTSVNDFSTVSIPLSSVYPNPVSEYFTIGLKPATVGGKRRVEVVNIKGSVIVSIELTGTEDKVIINTADWNSGIYVYKIYSEESIETGKIVKQ